MILALTRRNCAVSSMEPFNSTTPANFKILFLFHLMETASFWHKFWCQDLHSSRRTTATKREPQALIL